MKRVSMMIDTSDDVSGSKRLSGTEHVVVHEQESQQARDQHNNQIRRSMQLLEKPDKAIAEGILGDNHRQRYFGAAAHALGETGEAGVE